MAVRKRKPRWQEEWDSLVPAQGTPAPETRFERAFLHLDENRVSYAHLCKRAGFGKDPFLRTELRRWAKAGWVVRTVADDGVTELWALPTVLVRLKAGGHR